MGLIKGVVNMFYTPETRIKQKQYRINLLTQRNAAENIHLIAALKREIRMLEAKKDD